MSGFGEVSTASRMRDTLRRIITGEIDSQRPRHRYATVNSIDRVNRKCTVTFPGDPAAVTVFMGAVQPSATSQVVRIEGLAGDRFITDVMGPAYFDGAVSPLVTATYTPTYSSTGGGATLGTGGTTAGRYAIMFGKFVFLNIIVAYGTTPVAGSGVYRLSLPSGLLTPNIAGHSQVGSARVFDSGTGHYGLVPYISNNTGTIGAVTIAGGGEWGPGGPITPATGDAVIFNMFWELA